MSPETLLDRILWTQPAHVVHGSPPEWEPQSAIARAIRAVRPWNPLALIALALLSGCGAGVAGVVAATGGSSGGSAPTVLTSFQVINPKVSPATLRLGVKGAAAVRAALFYQRSGQPRQPMNSIAGVTGNAVVLADPGAELSWNFAAEPLLEGERFVDAVTLTIEFPGGTIPDGGVLQLGIGNDAPVIEEVVAPTGVLTGVVPVGVRVSDTSSDVISIALEWRRQGESDGDWKPATPASVFGDEEPLEGIQATREGVARTFSWNTATDLLDEDADVELRFTPDDGTRDGAGNPVGRGVSVVSSAFRIENRGKPILTSFQVLDPQLSPARLRLVLVQAQSENVEVEFFYQRLGGPEIPMTRIAGATGSTVLLSSSPGGESSELVWDFASESGLGPWFALVRLILRSTDGFVLSGGVLDVGLGNDAPELLEAVLPDSAEVSSVVPIRLRVADSSNDVVAIHIEYDVVEDIPDAGWRTARPAGLDPAAPTPDAAISGVLAPPVGTDLVFFWDTDFDLAHLEHDVRLRFTAADDVSVGAPLLSAPLRVDNNAAPIVQFDSGTLILNPDERRGIPIPFRVIDEEGDLVEVIFQWRREGETFPALPTANAALDAILADPVQRQEKHVCTPYPHFARGRVVPIDANTVRLPELARSESWILAAGIEGRTLELLRPSSIPSPITPTWRSNPLVSPIVALQVGDGLTVLVLDVPGTGRLREIELATGAVVRDIATLGPGISGAMAFEHGERVVLVALDDAGTWRIERVELASGAITQLVVSDGTEPAPVRGLASLGTNAAVFTAGSSLFFLDYRDSLAPQLGKLLTGLAAPWGVIVDPLPPDRIYLSERDANRVLAIDLDSHGKLPVVVKTADMQLGTLESPTALALERHGSRMLIVTNATGGGRQLLGLDLGATGGNVSFPIGAPTTADVASVATGSDELRLLSLPASNELLVAGGIEQRRAIATHSLSSQDVSVETPLDPVPSPGQPWRLHEDAQRLLRASAQGVAARFVWDSTDAPGSVFVRATARDDEVSVAADGAAPKRVLGDLEVDPLVLGGPGTTNGAFSVAVADLDGDGDGDIVSANPNGNNLTVFFQLSPGSFTTAPLVLGGFGVTNGPISVVTADFDGDGDQDLVSANVMGNNLTVFFQLSPGSFAATPLVLGGPGTTNSARSVAAADLDGDGDQDLASASLGSDNLTVYFQLTPGSFAASPLVLGGAATTTDALWVTAADLDGDGDQDLASANSGSSSNLTVFFQLSPGSFATAPLVLGGPGTTDRPVHVAAADLDGDGDQDLVSANFEGDNLTVFFQISPGSFAAAPLFLGGPGTTNGPFSVTAADLDGDGDQDILSANQDDNTMTVFFQLSPGNFEPAPIVLGGFPTTSQPVSVGAADLDGDGDQDLVSANFQGNNLTVFFQASPATFDSTALVLGGAGVTDGPRSLAVADLNSDGNQDVVTANEGGDNLTLFLNAASGRFRASQLGLGGPGINRPVWITAADLDSDGDQDLATANAGSGNLKVLFQVAPGSFQTPPLTLDVTGVQNVAMADVDSDGDQDMVAASLANRNLTVFIQSAPGDFSTSPLLVGAGTTRPVMVAAADLDSNGEIDLVAANATNLMVFFHAATGGFEPSPLILDGPGVTGPVATADLNSDGAPDLVAVNEGACCDFYLAFFQTLPGTFQSTPVFVGAVEKSHFRSLAAADLDSDGDQDLLATSEASNDLKVFTQGAPGSFHLRVLGDTGGSWISAADLDSDGELDLAVANRVSDLLTVFWGGR